MRTARNLLLFVALPALLVGSVQAYESLQGPTEARHASEVLDCPQTTQVAHTECN